MNLPRSSRDVTVLIDGDVLRRYKGGIRRTAAELQGSLLRARPTWHVLTVPKNARVDRAARSWHSPFGPGLWRRVYMAAELAAAYTLWPQVVVPLIALIRRADVIICPNYVFPVLRSKRCIVVVHDLSSVTEAARNRRSARSFAALMESAYFWLVRWSTTLALARAGAVVVPSRKVQRDILLNMKVGSAPIFVVPWGVGAEWGDAGPATEVGAEGVRQQYVLCVNPHSAALLGKIAAALYTDPSGGSGCQIGVTLKVVGQLHDPESLPPMVEYLGVVSDSELGHLYRRALAVVIPATNSGFGLPLLEALASGCPCIVRTGTAEAEVASGHGVYEVDGEVGSWAMAIGRLAASPVERFHASREGQSWARQFTWDRVGGVLASVIETITSVR